MRPAWPRAVIVLWIWLAAVATTAVSDPRAGTKAGFTVSGTVVAPHQAVLQSGAVLMKPAAGDALASHPADEVSFLPDGSFSFRNVAPGLYQIRARAQTASGAAPLFAGYRVQVRDRDVTGLRLSLRAGGAMTGVVVIEPPSAGVRVPPFDGLRVRAPFVDGSRFGDALTGRVQRDGQFRLTGIMEGDHVVALDGLPEPWVLKRALWRGVDVAATPFTVASGEMVSGVRIEISARADEPTPGTARRTPADR
jgi:hypothetical protein